MAESKEGKRRINRAIISVSNKEGLIEFARGLKRFGVVILSTGGTKRYLKENGIAVESISDYTGFPEILDGRVKTLHPLIHGGILAVREKEGHMKDLKEAGIKPIDMVVVNLYPFEERVAKGCNMEEAIEEIDIGGPSMIRAAAKNFRDVTVVTDPKDYEMIIKEMESQEGALSLKTRFALARKVFQLTSKYDYAIYTYLNSLFDKSEERFPQELLLSFHKIQDLRYGENPHQEAAFYGEKGVIGPCLSNAKKLQGKELSYNNILDLDSANRLVMEYDEPCIAIVKHNNPCGVAISDRGIKEAYLKALSCDPVSAFGGIIASNRIIDGETAMAMSKVFLEAIIAPGFDSVALEVFSRKKGLRLMELPMLEARGEKLDSNSYKAMEREAARGYDLRRVSGGLLIQTRDDKEIGVGDLKVVTERKPTKKEIKDMLFAFKVCKHVKSNAIVFARDGQTIGIGAGQMSRVDSVKIGIMKAKEAGLLGGDLKSTSIVMASDAFFPFRDSIDIAVNEGIKAVIQPGGSIRDKEVIQAANEYGIAMVFTGVRHFRH